MLCADCQTQSDCRRWERCAEAAPISYIGELSNPV